MFGSHNIDLTEEERLGIMHGATERDLAHSGLEDTMISSLLVFVVSYCFVLLRIVVGCCWLLA